jgi:hypothetical protein
MKHPAVLLVLGFIFTTVIGSVLSGWWQYQQWARQETLRANEEATKERLAVAEDVLHLFAFSWHQKSEVVTLKERASHWTLRSREWRVAEKVLVARASSAFPDAVTRKLLQTIIDDRTLVGNDIENLLSIADTQRGHYSQKDLNEIDETSKHALSIINGVSREDQKLAKLISHMIAETRNAQNTPPPKSLWRWLW